MDIVFFETPAGFRTWLEQYHAEVQELWVGYYKKGSGFPSMTWPESVDEALCFGWIDGVRKTIDALRYTIRFTPRALRSTWSLVNVNRVAELCASGRIHPAGMRAFEARAASRSGVYAHEQRQRVVLDEGFERQFRADVGAWGFFQAQPAWYRRAAVWWVMSAKRDATRERRLTRLIADSAGGRAIKELMRPPQSQLLGGANDGGVENEAE